MFAFNSCKSDKGEFRKTMKMKQSYSSFSYGPILTVIGLALLVAITVFSYFQLRSMDNRMAKAETQIVESMQKSTAVVNFINSALSSQQEAK